MKKGYYRYLETLPTNDQPFKIREVSQPPVIVKQNRSHDIPPLFYFVSGCLLTLTIGILLGVKLQPPFDLLPPVVFISVVLGLIGGLLWLWCNIWDDHADRKTGRQLARQANSAKPVDDDITSDKADLVDSYSSTNNIDVDYRIAPAPDMVGYVVDDIDVGQELTSFEIFSDPYFNRKARRIS